MLEDSMSIYTLSKGDMECNFRELGDGMVSVGYYDPKGHIYIPIDQKISIARIEYKRLLNEGWVKV
jgi:hypothetical protein